MPFVKQMNELGLKPKELHVIHLVRHGNHAAYADHLARRYLDNLVLSHACGQPVEMMLTLGAVITGGVLARFPCRQCVVSAEPEEAFVKSVVAELGDENLVLSTDWPHDDSRFPHAIDGFLAEAPLSPDSKRKILWDNCARLYKL